MRVRSFIVLLSLTSVFHIAAQDWPDFRGPTGDGQVKQPDGKAIGLPVRWSETENVKWKTEIPYHGIASPVIGDGQIWLTTATVEGHDFYVIRVDAATGKITLNEKLFHSDNPEPLGNGASMNSYATPSPVLEPGRIYVHYGSFGTAALDTASGKVLWKRDDLRCRHYRGASSSPVLFDNLVILTFDGADLQYHAALDKQTGKTVWKTDRSVKWNDENVPGQMAKDGDLRKAHSTPLIVSDAGKPLMLSSGAKAAYGYDPRKGQELWKVQYNDWSVAPRPLYQQGIAYFVTGLTRKELWAVKTGGSGDVSDSGIVWKVKIGVGKYASPILVDGRLFSAADESFLTCYEAKTGQTVWNERVGGKFSASPIYGDGHLYFCDQGGKTLVVKPGDALNIISTNTLSGEIKSSPAVSGKALFIRTRTHLYRIES